MDNFSLIQLADNCCPKLFKKFIGVASSDNFFSGREFEELLDTAVTTGRKFFYQIVNSAAQTEAWQHWLLLSYILIDPSKKQALTCSDPIITIVLWYPLAEISLLLALPREFSSTSSIDYNASQSMKGHVLLGSTCSASANSSSERSHSMQCSSFSTSG